MIHDAAHVAHANDFTNTNSVVSFIPTLPISYCTLSLVRGRPAGVWACGAERCCTGHSFRFPLTPRSCLFLYSVDFSTTSLVRRLACLAPCTQANKALGGWRSRTLWSCVAGAWCPFHPTGYSLFGGVVIRMAMDMDVQYSYSLSYY
jgi:hypothetical protein